MSTTPTPTPTTITITTTTTTQNQTPTTSTTTATNNTTSNANIIESNDDNHRMAIVDRRPPPRQSSQQSSQQLTLFSSKSTTTATVTNLNQSDFSKWVETQLDHRTILDENFKQLQQFILGKLNVIQQFERNKSEHTDRIQLLENALRESVVIVKEREDEFCMLERLKIEMCERIQLLEQKIHSLQNTNSNYKCCACRNLKLKLDVLKEKILILLTERREKLQELTNTKQEILEMLLSEKDTQIALLEVSGAKTQEQIERLDRLRSDRFKLNKRLKVESENSLKLLSECKSLEIELSELLTKQI